MTKVYFIMHFCLNVLPTSTAAVMVIVVLPHEQEHSPRKATSYIIKSEAPGCVRDLEGCSDMK